MNHLKWMGHISTIMDIQGALRNDADTCDVTLAAKDGTNVRAHRFVLSTCSDLLRSLLVDVPRESDATIILPDIHGSLLERMLSFMYMGETNLPSANLTDFLEAINVLGIKSAISFECSSSNMSAAVAASGNIITQTENVDPTSTAVGIKTIEGLQISHEELMEEEEKLGNVSEIVEQQAGGERDMEYIDMYSEQPKITYSIEHMSGTNSGTEYILTENANYTITQASEKLQNNESNNTAEVEDSQLIEDDEQEDEEDAVDDGQMIEEVEEYNSNDPLIDISSNAEIEMEVSQTPITQIVASATSSATVANVTPRASSGVRPKLRFKPPKVNTEKILSQQQQQQDKINSYLNSHMKSRSKKDPIEIDNLELAAQSVLTEGLSLQKAADKFDISKTVLWRRVRKEPGYQRNGREKPTLSLAYERLKRGDSLKNISRDLDIPMSTLHRHKVRLSQEGRLPDFVTCKRRESTPKEELHEKLAKAVHACVHEGMSQNHAANVFEIPKSTLWRHLRRRVANAEMVLDADDIKTEEDLT